MNFWDSSSILPLLVAEENSVDARALLEAEPEMAIWWATPVECMSALARKEREDRLDLKAMATAQKNLSLIEANSIRIDPTDPVRRMAQKLLRRYPLRTVDSLQLAAACVLAGEDNGTCGFVCNDERLSLAASKEGFALITPGGP